MKNTANILMKEVEKRNPHQPEFLQAVSEDLEDV